MIYPDNINTVIICTDQNVIVSDCIEVGRVSESVMLLSQGINDFESKKNDLDENTLVLLDEDYEGSVEGLKCFPFKIEYQKGGFAGNGSKEVENLLYHCGILESNGRTG